MQSSIDQGYWNALEPDIYAGLEYVSVLCIHMLGRMMID